MSVYTTQVRWIIESGKTLNLSTYPIFDESYRNTLNKKIIDHFYFREIGFETVGLFNNRLAAKLNEIMPYYNRLYNSALLNVSPLFNRIYKETYSRMIQDKGTMDGSDQRTAHTDKTVDSKMEGNSSRENGEYRHGTMEYSGEQEGKVVGSATPQGLLAAENIDSDLYASEASLNKGKENNSTGSTDYLEVQEGTTTDQSGSSKEIGTTVDSLRREQNTANNKWESFTRSLEGLEGTSQAKLLQEFRDTFLNIDMMIIEELEVLFMNIW